MSVSSLQVCLKR